jgi:hypothetical protein
MPRSVLRCGVRACPIGDVGVSACSDYSFSRKANEFTLHSPRKYICRAPQSVLSLEPINLTEFMARGF